MNEPYPGAPTCSDLTVLVGVGWEIQLAPGLWGHPPDPSQSMWHCWVLF